MPEFDLKTKQWEAVKIAYAFPLDTFLGEQILSHLKETPNRILQIYHEENYEITCDEFRVSSVRAAQNLTKLGIGADDVVSFICHNSSTLSFLLTGCVLIGAPISPLDLSFTVNDLKHLLGQTKPKLIVCEKEILARVRQALMELDFDSQIFVASDEEVTDAQQFSELLIPTGTENDFFSPKFTQTADKKILGIVCSSGTTGMPKGVIVSHVDILWHITLMSLLPTRADSRSFCFNSVFWRTGFLYQMLLAFNKREVRIWTRNGFSCELFSEIFEKYKITDVFLVPIHLAAVLQSDYKSIPNIDGLQRTTCGGANVSGWLRTKFSEAFPKQNMLITYGMTEGMTSATTATGFFREKRCVGSLLPNVIVKVVDENETRMGSNEVGEIRTKAQFKFQVRI